MTTPQLTTTPVCEVQVKIQGDVGGVGLSRFRFIRNDAGVPTVGDCNTAGAAVRALYNALTTWPSAIQVAVQPTVEMFDIGTALVAGQLVMSTPPAAINGTGSGGYGAGLGVRINWHTQTVVGRRMLRGATFLIPLIGSVFGTTGSVTSGTVTTVNTAAANYISAMASGGLVPVVWHRPTSSAPNSGVIGPILGGAASSQPAGLRSRRS